MEAFINGTYCEKALISPYDLGFLRGFGLFEYFRTYQRQPTFLEARLQRLKDGANQLGICFDYTKDEVFQILSTLLKHHPEVEEVSFRLILTKGISEDGLTPKQASSFIVLIKPFINYPLAMYQKGIFTITKEEPRSLPHLKTLNYLPALLALEVAKHHNSQEVLYLSPHKEILEGTTSNFFAVKNGVLFTASSQILHGITRNILLKLACPFYAIQPCGIFLQDLDTIEEAFITSSTREIVPVVKIDQQIIGKGMPGPITYHLQKLFRQAIVAENESHTPMQSGTPSHFLPRSLQN